MIFKIKVLSGLCVFLMNMATFASDTVLKTDAQLAEEAQKERIQRLEQELYDLDRNRVSFLPRDVQTRIKVSDRIYITKFSIENYYFTYDHSLFLVRVDAYDSQRDIVAYALTAQDKLNVREAVLKKAVEKLRKDY